MKRRPIPEFCFPHEKQINSGSVRHDSVFQVAESSVSSRAAIELRQCSSCKKAKLINEFYSHNIFRCKECMREYSKEYYKNHIDRCRKSRHEYYKKHKDIFRKRTKEYYDNLKKQGRSYYELYTKTYKSQHKKEGRVYQKVNKALANGLLTRPNVCEMCGNTGSIVAHHDNYNQPLIVKWLCHSCHSKIHQNKN